MVWILFFTSSNFWEFVSARIKWIQILKPQTILPIEKKKQTWSNVINGKSYFPKRCQKKTKKNRPILKHPKNQTPAEKVSLVKRINEGYFLFHLFLFVIFLQTK